MPDESPLSPDEAPPLGERPVLHDLIDYEHLLPKVFVDFVKSVE